MDLLEKPDTLAPAFEIAGETTAGNSTGTCGTCGQPVSSPHCATLKTKDGVQLDGDTLPRDIKLPPTLTPGGDYAIVLEDDELIAKPFAFSEDLVGGFHVFMTGEIARQSIWDRNFRPSHFDPRGMVLWNPGGFPVSWIDIYETNTEPWRHGTSKAGVKIADGGNPPWFAEGLQAENFNFWTAQKILALYGKQLLSAPEFIGAMSGTTEDKTCGTDPDTTGHIAGLRSAIGVEHASGCMWNWLREQTQYGSVRIAGGYWDSSRAGARLFNACYADNSFDYVGARGRCDHLQLD